MKNTAVFTAASALFMGLATTYSPGANAELVPVSRASDLSVVSQRCGTSSCSAVDDSLHVTDLQDLIASISVEENTARATQESALRQDSIRASLSTFAEQGRTFQESNSAGSRSVMTFDVTSTSRFQLSGVIGYDDAGVSTLAALWLIGPEVNIGMERAACCGLGGDTPLSIYEYGLLVPGRYELGVEVFSSTNFTSGRSNAFADISLTTVPLPLSGLLLASGLLGLGATARRRLRHGNSC